MTSVVVHTNDVVGPRMAGPGIRAFHFASELSQYYPTTLVCASEPDQPRLVARFEIFQLGSREASTALRSASVVIGQPSRALLSAVSSRSKTIFDLFDPLVLELSELYRHSMTSRKALHLNREWSRLRKSLVTGDALIAATSDQRALYTGIYLSDGGKDPRWQDRWILVPFGIEERSPDADGPPMRNDGRPIIAWGGGVWPWLDPLTAQRAVESLNSKGVDCRLLFLGSARPNSKVRGVEEQRFSSESVVWNTEWTPYRERARWLRASSAAIMLHRRTLESRFSIRTRLFDAIWCGLPVIATREGFAADLVEREGLGVVVEPEDIRGVEEAIRRILQDDDFRTSTIENLDRVRAEFVWSKVTRPLIEKIAEWQ
ncbi:MAG TPA: glycosyltransferase family 4 protein [Thermoanaerobaculia bacterium]|nr:glycosyltransferase family 4 protein [Thermoanaerobaculia bacterium]